MYAHRRSFTWALLLTVSAATLALDAGQAEAANVSYATDCTPPKISGLPVIHGTTIADLSSSKSSPVVGDTVTITWKTVKAASNNPGLVDLPANVVTPTGTITMGGAQSGSLSAKGPKSNPATKKNSPMQLSAMTASVKLTKAGSVTFRPGAYNINVDYIVPTDTSCKPSGTPGVSLTLTVGAGSSGGGTTGGSTTTTGGSSTTGGSGTTGSSTTTGGSTGTTGGTGSSTTTGGDLAATGGDGSTVQALGLAGGTVLLVGAAVAVLTPWRRLRRSR
ncbi:hypothetical protein [Streptacidiphilus cavernicola]|uniref:LPXTG cell wall anchor domain-containing protein n=1 Tax=Streptacidiphilus cavernicola TaxID=3342716 RepID=A0ABV6VTT1_9ACTN